MLPLQFHLVLIGGGHAHVYLLKEYGSRKWRSFCQKYNVQVHVTLITRDLHTPYSGMLPGFVAGHYTYEEMHINLVKLCLFSNVTFHHAEACRVTYDAGPLPSGKVFCTPQSSNEGSPLYFDALSIDIGSSPSPIHSSIIDHPKIISVKPISQFCEFYLKMWERESNHNRIAADHQDETQEPLKNENSNSRDESLEQDQPLQVVIVGGGAGGVELALSVQYHLEKKMRRSIEMTLVTKGSSLLSEHNAGVQEKVKRIYKRKKVKVVCDFPVSKTEDNSLVSELQLETGSVNRRAIPFDFCIFCTTANGATWLQESTPFPCSDRGFVLTNATLQVIGHPGVFAAGDCCDNIDHPRPKAGVFAVRAGPPLFKNLKLYISAKTKRKRPRSSQQSIPPLVHYVPQSTFLGLLSTGDHFAIASYGSYISFQGRWVWKWKNRIDRKWMKQYSW
mmetsp:Transcript_8062/g.11707  ORF Transcript_8062/g.11707 Transcript_8062/m.11707 type:complete len:447 (+) Transcript_8062:30-1370(+)